jgi:hypothetical protein
MQKGQASLEFLFLVLIVIVYLTTTIMPLTKDASSAVSDVDSLAKANNETQKIINSINRVAAYGEGTRETLNILIPQNTTLFCADTNISFKTTLLANPYPSQCPSGICNKYFPTPQNTTLDCKLQTIIGPTKAQIIIEKSGTNKVIFTQG